MFVLWGVYNICCCRAAVYIWHLHSIKSTKSNALNEPRFYNSGPGILLTQYLCGQVNNELFNLAPLTLLPSINCSFGSSPQRWPWRQKVIQRAMLDRGSSKPLRIMHTHLHGHLPASQLVQVLYLLVLRAMISSSRYPSIPHPTSQNSILTAGSTQALPYVYDCQTTWACTGKLEVLHTPPVLDEEHTRL